MRSRLHRHLLWTVAALFGCASAPTAQLGESEATLRAAEAVDAQQYPKAAYHLELARKQITDAKPLIDGSRSDKKHAAMLLTRAELDAELALQMAQTFEAQAEAQRAWDEVQELKGETK